MINSNSHGGVKHSKCSFILSATVMLIIALTLGVAFHLKEQASDQRDILDDIIEQAENDLTFGLMHVSLSGEHNHLQQRSIGLALLRQAGQGYEQAVQTLAQDTAKDFSSSISALQASLQQLYEAPQGEIQAQVFTIGRNADLLENQMAQVVEQRHIQQTRWFTAVILLSSVTLLALLGMALVRSEKTRRILNSSLKLSEQRFLQLLQNTDDVYWLESFNTRQLLYVSPAFETTTGVKVQQVLNKFDAWAWLVHPDDKEKVAHLRANVVQGSQDVECRVIRPDGKVLWLAGRIFAIWSNGQKEAGGNPDYTAAIVRDVTEKRAMDHKLFQVQKMDSLGQLTGGVAHDFNNLLTVILINTQNLIPRLADHPDLARMMELIMRAAKRGASMNQQLLAFASKQQLQPKVVLIQELVAESVEMLQRTLGEKFELELQQNASNVWVKVDPGQLQNALVNLCINSRDAMPEGGKISLRLNRSGQDNLYGVPGETVHLAVKDNGCGIPAALLDRVLEPFYTTKPADKGTGLGLSMVFGFVRQSGGNMHIASKQGKGTTVHMVLPVSQPGPQVGSKILVGEKVDAHVALLVEDDDLVRESTASVLQAGGLRVIQAGNAEDALSILSVKAEIEIIITDVVMPGSLSGFELAEQVERLYPHIKIVVMSGYVGDNNRHSSRWIFLQKPFSNESLLNTVRESLSA